MSLIKQSIDFLQYSKSKGVNNCDIKPENIVIKNNKIKFIDFDIAIKIIPSKK